MDRVGERRPRFVTLAVRLDEVEVLRPDAAPEPVVGARALADRRAPGSTLSRICSPRSANRIGGRLGARFAQWTNSLIVKTLSQALGTRLQMWETCSQDIARIRSGVSHCSAVSSSRERGPRGRGRGPARRAQRLGPDLGLRRRLGTGRADRPVDPSSGARRSTRALSCTAAARGARALSPLQT